MHRIWKAIPINFDYSPIWDPKVSLKGFFTDTSASVIELKHLVNIMRRGQLNSNTLLMGELERSDLWLGCVCFLVYLHLRWWQNAARGQWTLCSWIYSMHAWSSYICLQLSWDWFYYCSRALESPFGVNAPEWSQFSRPDCGCLIRFLHQPVAKWRWAFPNAWRITWNFKPVQSHFTSSFTFLQWRDLLRSGRHRGRAEPHLFGWTGQVSESKCAFLQPFQVFVETMVINFTRINADLPNRENTWALCSSSHWNIDVRTCIYAIKLLYAGLYSLHSFTVKSWQIELLSKLTFHLWVWELKFVCFFLNYY